MLKRILSMLLCAVMVLELFPMPVFATETNLDTGDVSIEGSNAFGELMAEQIESTYSGGDTSGAYGVTGLTIAGSTAVVEYSAEEEAILMVALYSEDGLQMLTSGKTTVSPDATEATVTISNVPTYFVAEAFLVDTYDYSPLCPSYETPVYTQAMQELLASTVEDYDSDRVLNLDSDNTTNFAVYGENTVLVEEQSGVNTILSADEENLVYVIGNADDTFLYLQPGDVVSYDLGGEEYLFIKAAEVTVEDTTVTIQGAQVELEDVFSHVKIEGNGDADDAVVDESTMDSGVVYLGKGGAAAYSLQDRASGSVSSSLNYCLEDNGFYAETNLELEVEFSFYHTEERTHIELVTNTDLNIHVGFSAEYEGGRPIKKLLGKIRIPFAYGSMDLVCAPQFSFEASAELYTEVGITSEDGFAYDSESGFKTIKSAPVLDWGLEAEGKLFIGIDLCPGVECGKGLIFDVGASIPIGVEITATYKPTLHSEIYSERPESIHTCENCVAMEAAFQIEFVLEVEVFNILHKEQTFASAKKPIGEMYYSIDHMELGKGQCPYLSHRITVTVRDQEGKAQSGAIVSVDGSSAGITNGKGMLETYLTGGRHVLTAGTAKRTTQIKAPALVALVLGEEKDDTPSGGSSADTFLGDVDSSIITDWGKIIDAGTLGTISWVIYEGGVIAYSGTGELTAEHGDKWHTSINTIIIKEGITAIGDDAFKRRSTSLTALRQVVLPQSLRSIGNRAFYDNWDLNKVNLPNGLETIGEEVFYNSELETVYIPESVTSIGQGVFSYCSSLQNVTVDAKITHLPDSIFKGASWYDGSLSVTLPDGLISIGEEAFAESYIKSIDIPDTVTSIGKGAFKTCYALETIDLSQNLTGIPEEAFLGCNLLKDVSIPEKMTSIGASAFTRCEAITKIEIPDSVTSIGADAFRACSNLSEVKLPEGLTRLESGTFAECVALPKINIPRSVTTMSSAFSGCTALKRVDISDIRAWCSIEYGWPECNPLHGGADLYLNGERLTNLDIRVVENGDYFDIGSYAFSGCSSLETIALSTGDYAGSIGLYGWDIFKGCQNLRKVEFTHAPGSISGGGYFKNCPNLTEIVFAGEPPIIGWNPSTQSLYADWSRWAGLFEDVTATVYYPQDERYWDTVDASTWGGTLTLVPYTLDENGDMILLETMNEEPEEEESSELEQTTEQIVEEVPQTQPVPDVTQTQETLAETENEETESERSSEPEDETEETPETAIDPKSQIIPEFITEPETEPEPEKLGETSLRAVLNLFALPVMAEETQTTEAAQPSEETQLVQSKEPAESAPEEPGQSEDVPTAEDHQPSFYAIFGGEYTEEPKESYTLKTATFTGLVPGEEYIMYAMISKNASDPISTDNLLAVDQATAGSDGRLVFEYVQRRDTSVSYVVACGASNKNLKNATITFRELQANGLLQSIMPEVSYYGARLEEGKDYVVVGQVAASNLGSYICYIRGIHNYTGLVKCTWMLRSGIENRVTVDATDMNGQTSVWIDGVEYVMEPDDGVSYVDLPDSSAKTMIVYTYHVGDASDVHTQYPVSIKVWTLSNTDGIYTVTRVETLDDILQYSGSSIRVTGQKGIRMITSMERTKKNALVSGGLAGYTLKEYGTVVAWTSQMGDEPLVLGKSYAKSNYAYKKGAADPVFAYDGDLMQYTNVLVGFSNAQCKKDLAMRPYMILEDAEDNEITLYGGIVTRSIGYIAYQNRNAFTAGTEAYKYVWDIIHSVYGDAYDAEYAA